MKCGFCGSAKIRGSNAAREAIKCTQCGAFKSSMGWRRDPKKKPVEFAIDPVHGEGDSWYFWDETWANEIGPFSTREKAREELKNYCDKLDEERTLPALKGYEEADKIDKMINHLLTTHRIEKENAMEWMKFARTVKTYCDILLETAQFEIRRKTK